MGLSDRDCKTIRFSEMSAGEKRYVMYSKPVEEAEREKINAGLK